MVNPLLEFGTNFDWISPALAAVRDVANGGNYTFFVPEGCGWAARDIRLMLQGHGVRVWGLMTVNRLIMLTVRRAQARWAEYLMLRYGVPLVSGYAPRPGEPRRLHRTRTDPASPLTRFEQWVYRLQQRLNL